MGVGRVNIENTCTAGVIEIYGDIYVTQDSGVTATILDRTSASPKEIADEVWSKQI